MSETKSFWSLAKVIRFIIKVIKWVRSIVFNLILPKVIKIPALPPPPPFDQITIWQVISDHPCPKSLTELCPSMTNICPPLLLLLALFVLPAITPPRCCCCCCCRWWCCCCCWWWSKFAAAVGVPPPPYFIIYRMTHNLFNLISALFCCNCFTFFNDHKWDILIGHKLFGVLLAHLSGAIHLK